MDPGDVASAINIPGIVNDLKSANRPDGMSIVWENGSQAKGLRAKSTEGTIIAAVTLGGYSGEGLNKGLGIESISGFLRIAFDAMVDATSATLDKYVVSESSLTLKQENESTTYRASIKASGNAKIEIEYAESTSGTLAVTTVEVSVSATVDAGASITVEGTTIVDNSWKGGVDTSWYDSSQGPFTISTPDQLAGLAQIVNEKIDNFYNKTITLSADLDMGNHPWTPIGNIATPINNEYIGKESGYNLFKGTFNGNGKTISNLDIKCSTDSSTGSGLFGVVGGGASIIDLTIENCRAMGGSSSFFVGSFVGLIPHCDSGTPTEDDTVNLEKLNLTGSVQIQGAASFGGIVGRNHTASRISIKNCHVDAAAGSFLRGVVGGPSIMGGIIGAAYGTHGNNANVIENCSVSIDTIAGDVQCIGGIAGHFEEGRISQVSVIDVDISLKPAPNTSSDYYGYDPYGIGLVAGTVGGTEPVSGTDPYSPQKGHEVNYYQSGCQFTDSTLSSGPNTPYEGQDRYSGGLFGTVRNTQKNSNYQLVSPEKVVVFH